VNGYVGGVRRCEPLLEPRAGLLRMVVKRSESSTIHNRPRFIDDVNALGPSAVSQVRRLMHVIYTNGQGKVEPQYEIVGDRYSLNQRLRLRVTNAFIYVALHLPFVLRMRFANINGQKVGLSLVVVVQTDEVAYLAPEWRSGIASKDEDERTSPDTFA
jgi:hypothetical protein